MLAHTKWSILLVVVMVILLLFLQNVSEAAEGTNLYTVEQISSLPATHVSDITSFGKYVYFEDGWVGEALRVVDTTNPAFPKIVGSTTGSYELTFDGSDGSYGYGIKNGLAIYDLLDPTQPVLLNDYNDFPTYKGYYADVIDVAVYHQTAYVSYAYWFERCYGGGNVAIIDVSDPLNPVMVSVMGSPTEWRGVVRIDDHYAYMIGPASVQVFDITDPHTLTYVGSGGGAGEIFSYTSNMVISNHELYVTTHYFSTPCGGVRNIWQVLSLTDPSYLAPIAVYPDKAAHIYTIANGYIYGSLNGNWAEVVSVDDYFTPVFEFYPFAPYVISVVDGFMYVGHQEGVNVMRMSAAAEWVTPAGTATLAYTDTYGLAANLEIGAGTVVSPTRLSYLPYPAVDDRPQDEVFVAAFDVVGYGEQFTLEQFERPVTITLAYRDTRFGRLVIGEAAHLLRWTGADWQEAAESCAPAGTYWRDPAQFTLQLAVCLPGKYVLVAPAGPQFLPLTLQP